MTRNEAAASVEHEIVGERRSPPATRCGQALSGELDELIDFNARVIVQLMEEDADAQLLVYLPHTLLIARALTQRVAHYVRASCEGEA